MSASSPPRRPARCTADTARTGPAAAHTDPAAAHIAARAGRTGLADRTGPVDRTGPDTAAGGTRWAVGRTVRLAGTAEAAGTPAPTAAGIADTAAAVAGHRRADAARPAPRWSVARPRRSAAATAGWPTRRLTADPCLAPA